MHAFRTRFKKDIVCEFLPPPRPTKQCKVIILAGGMPGYPAKTELMFFLAKKGYWVFNPRYRGTWESGGRFLAKSPEQDILDVVDGLGSRFVSFWDKVQYKVVADEIFIVGSSFGGPAAIIASLDARVAKIVGLSPVVDWQAPSKDEPLGFLGNFVKLAFNNGYRFSLKDWKKLSSGTFYNPIQHTKNLDGSKMLLIHAKDDTIVTYGPVKKFANTIGAKLITLPRGGHLGSSLLMKPTVWKKISQFLKT